MTGTLRIVFFSASLTALLACGDDSAPVCTAGMSVACTGPGGCAGGQVCNADGTGFGECVCGASDAGPGDTGVGDTGVGDTGVGDTGTDTGTADSSPQDTGVDTGPTAEFLCNPLTPMECEGATPRCTATFADGAGVFDCAAEGDAALGESCTAAGIEVDNCQSSTLCIEGTCREICDALTGSCVSGGDCSALSIATEEVPLGVCLSPSS